MVCGLHTIPVNVTQFGGPLDELVRFSLELVSLQLLWSAAVLPSADGPESDADVDHDDVRKSDYSLLLSLVHALALTCGGRVQIAFKTMRYRKINFMSSDLRCIPCPRVVFDTGHCTSIEEVRRK